MKLYTEEKICDFCESQLKNPYKPINTKRSILTYICDNCYLIQSIPQKKFASEPKPSMSFDADRSSIMYTKELVLPRHISFFKKHKISFSRMKRILDIGSNRGNFIKFLLSANKNVKIVAVETRKKLLKEYKGQSNIKSYNIRFEKFKINCKFDFIYNVHTLEHFTSSLIGLKKMHSFLKPNGKIFLAVPNTNLFNKNTFEELFIDPHTFHFTHNTLINYFNKVGLKILYKSIDSNELQYLLVKMNKNYTQNKKSKKILFFDKKKSLEKYKKILTFNRKKMKKYASTIKMHSKKNEIIFWGAGRIFDGLIKLGKIKPSKNYKVVDIALYKYFRQIHGFKIKEPESIKKEKKNKILVICSRQYKRDIVNAAKKFLFKKIISIA